jgi:peptidoglycan hydrolase CwlO-like protein
MSTAGKVLIVLVMLMTFVWIVLTSGVSRLNTNANTRLHELKESVEKLQVQVEDTQAEVASLLTQTRQAQEKVDNESALLKARQSDLERAKSKIADTLASVKYELELIQGTVKGAQTDLEHRNIEQKEETDRLNADKADVAGLMADCSKLRDRLSSLRTEFKSNYHASLELLGKAASKTTEAPAGSAN